jgi:hypothetical protein
MNASVIKSLSMIFITGLQVKDENKKLKNNNLFFIKHSAGMNI